MCDTKLYFNQIFYFEFGNIVECFVVRFLIRLIRPLNKPRPSLVLYRETLPCDSFKNEAVEFILCGNYVKS